MSNYSEDVNMEQLFATQSTICHGDCSQCGIKTGNDVVYDPKGTVYEGHGQSSKEETKRTLEASLKELTTPEQELARANSLLRPKPPTGNTAIGEKLADLHGLKFGDPGSRKSKAEQDPLEVGDLKNVKFGDSHRRDVELNVAVQYHSIHTWPETEYQRLIQEKYDEDEKARVQQFLHDNPSEVWSHEATQQASFDIICTLADLEKEKRERGQQEVQDKLRKILNGAR